MLASAQGHSPEFVRSELDKVKAYLDASLFAEAQSTIEKIIPDADDPFLDTGLRSDIHFYEGVVLVSHEEVQKAEQEFRKMFQMAPDKMRQISPDQLSPRIANILNKVAGETYALEPQEGASAASQSTPASNSPQEALPANNTSLPAGASVSEGSLGGKKKGKGISGAGTESIAGIPLNQGPVASGQTGASPLGEGKEDKSKIKGNAGTTSATQASAAWRDANTKKKLAGESEPVTQKTELKKKKKGSGD